MIKCVTKLTHQNTCLSFLQACDKNSILKNFKKLIVLKILKLLAVLKWLHSALHHIYLTASIYITHHKIQDYRKIKLMQKC